MSGLARKIIDSPFVRSVAVLVSGTAIAQAISALATPVLSRLYDPTHFGLLALFSSVVSILAEASSARYELAIVLPKRHEDGANILALSCGVILITAALSLGAVAVGGQWLSTTLDSPELLRYLWWVPVALLAIGVFRSFSYWATRHQQFPSISIAQVSRAIGVVVVQILSGFAGGGAGGLIGGRVVGEATSLGTLTTMTRKTLRIKHLLTGQRIKELAREYSDFPKFSLPQSLVNAISQSVPVLMLAHYFDAGVVGIYAMAHRLLVLPSRLLSQSVRQVFLQKASETMSQGVRLTPLLARTTFGLASVVILPTIIVVLFGPWIFDFVLGSEWTAAGHYARWMILWLFFVYINPPSVVLTQVMRKNHYLLIYDVALLICRVIALVVGGLHYGPLTAVALFSCTGAIFNAVLIGMMFVVSHRQP